MFCQLSAKPSTNVSCQLNFSLFVSCQLKFWPFVTCQLTPSRPCAKPEMCLKFFSIRWHYTTTFRCVAVILVFFQRGLSLWFLDNLYFNFRFLVFAQNRPQNNDDDVLEWWKGQKKSLFIILGYFIQGFRLSQATVSMKSKVMATSLTNSSMQSF